MPGYTDKQCRNFYSAQSFGRRAKFLLSSKNKANFGTKSIVRQKDAINWLIWSDLDSNLSSKVWIDPEKLLQPQFDDNEDNTELTVTMLVQ